MARYGAVVRHLVEDVQLLGRVRDRLLGRGRGRLLGRGRGRLLGTVRDRARLRARIRVRVRANPNPIPNPRPNPSRNLHADGVNLVERVDARHVDTVTLDDVDQLVGGGIAVDTHLG